jgi:DegV family protein with EDD domain
MTVGIVTDSTAYLPEAVTSALAIEVVPVQVVVDGQALDELTGITVEEVTAALRAGKSVTTSRPNPDKFFSTYEQLIKNGCDSIVSVHLSGELSGTYESAFLASQKFQIPIRVIDSRAVAMMFGFAVETGARMAQAGASIDEVERAVVTRCHDSTIEFYVDTLEFLQRNGRISNTRSRVGRALSVKPLLHIEDGRVVQHELVRTSSKAVERLVEIATERASQIPSEIAVHHVDAFDRASEVAQQLC